MSSSTTLNRNDAFGSILGNLVDSNKGVRQVLLEQIIKSSVQPRTYFDKADHDKLVDSIKKHGVIQPVLLREITGGYELVAGERRVRASKDAGLEAIPALIKTLNDDQVREIALVENLQREDLNPVEETDGILQLLSIRLNISIHGIVDIIRTMHYVERGRAVNTTVDSSVTSIIEDVLRSLGHTSATSFYNHRLPILKLPKDLLETVRNGRLEYSKANLLFRIKEENQRKILTQQAIDEQWSRPRLEQEVKNLLTPSPLPKNTLITQTKKLLKEKEIKKLDQEKQKRVESLLHELNQLLTEK
jgi:ParB family transcriptional regulator, chromosome partitioning protein